MLNHEGQLSAHGTELREDAQVSDYQSFREFVEQIILPMQAANPGDARLDGQPSGGNRAVVGTFWHQGRRWKVHADTHYHQLLVAYQALRSGELLDPFVEQATARGKCLEHVPSLRVRTEDKHKHMYIYEA